MPSFPTNAIFDRVSDVEVVSGDASRSPQSSTAVRSDRFVWQSQITLPGDHPTAPVKRSWKLRLMPYPRVEKHLFASPKLRGRLASPKEWCRITSRTEKA